METLSLNKIQLPASKFPEPADVYVCDECGRDISEHLHRSRAHVVVNFFDSLEAVMRFAGTDYTVPVFEPQAKKLLCRIEPVASHYEVRLSTG